MKKILSFLFIIFLCSCSLEEKEEDKTTYYKIDEDVYVNYEPGIYNEPFELKIKSNKEILYSLDSSIPNEVYDNPITVDKYLSKDVKDYPLTKSVDGILAWDKGGKVVSKSYQDYIQRPGKYNLYDKQFVLTISYDNNGVKKTRSLSYIFGEFDIPVVSLSMPYDNWFGKTGIYNNIRDEYEQRCNFEYFDLEYDEYFYINTQIKIGGNYTMGYPQRTLNLNFNKDEYGNNQKKVNAHIFKDNKTLDNSSDLVKFSRLRLHNGGNCYENYTGINDAILHEMMRGTNVSTTSYRPCIVYLNGEYWGLYSIREHYKKPYFSTNYGVVNDSVAIYDYKGEFVFNDGDDSDFESFFAGLNKHLDKDFRDNNVYYDFIDKYVDIDSFIDVMIAEIFVCNRDFVGNNNNLKAWRTTSVDPNNFYADGRLRFCLHDADFAFTDASYWNFLDPNITNSYTEFKMFRKLLDNNEFKDKFYQRAVELVDTNLSYENACRVIDSKTSEIAPYKEQSNYRWGLFFWGKEINNINKVGLEGWYYEIEYAKNFVNTRINNHDEFKEENGNQNERNFLDAIYESLY